MKIALAQINYHIGNFEANYFKINKQIKEAKASGADLIVFSELAIGGYPARDFLEEPSFITACREQLEQLALICTDIACIIGCPVKNTAGEGKNLHNAAFLLADGIIKSQVNKALLPTYDVFDEYRYFEPAVNFACIEISGHKIALTICEDIWNVQKSMYTISPMDILILEDPELMINIAASPFHYSQAERRIEVLTANVARYKVPLIYVNHTGAQTELIFDGGSMVIASDLSVAARLAYFEEDLQYVDLLGDSKLNTHAQGTGLPDESTESRHSQAGLIPVLENITMRAADGQILTMPELADSVLDYSELMAGRIYQALVLGIRDYFRKSGFRSAVLGLSGGIDSALVCTLACDALGADNIHAVLMPSSYSSDHSLADARDLVANLGIHMHLVPITGVTSAYESALKSDFAGRASDIAEENLQARTRGTLLMAFSNKFGHILLNTSNKSEAAVGYGTLYGDMCGALSVLGDVYKLQVYQLCRYINRNKEIIPFNTISKPPSAELRPDQKDSDSLPPYELLDKILFLHIECKWGLPELTDNGFDQELVTRVIKLVNNAEFKRYQAAPILRISPKAFGMGRRMPIVGKYS